MVWSTVRVKWYYSHRLITVLYEVYDELTTLFQSMYDNVEYWDADTRASAYGFLQMTTSKEFKFLLKLFYMILPKTEVLFNVLQKKSFDINFSGKKIESFKHEIMLLKSSFQVIWNHVIYDSSSDSSLPAKRQRIDHVINEETSYRALMNEVIDNVTNRIQERFGNMTDLAFLSLVDADQFEILNNDQSFPNEAFQTLKKLYGQQFDFGILKTELEVMYADRDCYKRTLSDLYEYFLISTLDKALPQVFKLIELCLCIPATSAGVERSFSCLKRIHTYQRNTQGQERKSHLALISLEKEYLNILRSQNNFHDKVIETFKLKKDRRLLLDYK
ncbi:hypothetical protein WDU94_001890 [Cyamophila willieti]